MYEQGYFNDVGKKYLRPPARTAGRVVNFRVEGLRSLKQTLTPSTAVVTTAISQRNSHSSHSSHSNSSNNSSMPTKSNVVVPALLAPTNTALHAPHAPSSPATQTQPPLPTHITLINAPAATTTSHHFQSLRHDQNKKDKEKKKTKKKSSKSNKMKSTRSTRPPLAQRSINIQRRSRSPPSKRKSKRSSLPFLNDDCTHGSSNNSSSSSSSSHPSVIVGGARIVRIIAPKTMFVEDRPEHAPKTPPGKPVIRGRKRNIRAEMIKKTKRRQHTDSQSQYEKKKKRLHNHQSSVLKDLIPNDGRPYQYINKKTKRQGTVLSALGGNTLQRYYIQQHKPKTHVKRSSGLKYRTGGSGSTSLMTKKKIFL
jgi:hypothetical protein